MSESNRSGDSALGLRRWLIPAAIFAAVVVVCGGIQQRVYYNEAARHAAGYARNADNQIATECRVPTAPANCERAIDDAARKDQRDEYDLYSQKAMALWTAIMGAMAVVGVSLSGVGVYLIWRTWDATREAADNSRKTFLAYIAKERAILVIRGMQFSRIDSLAHPHCFSAKIQNRGTSPARLDSIAWEFLDGPVWPEELRFWKPDDGIIPVNGEGPAAFINGDTNNLDSTFLAVRLEYRTVEQGPYFCHAAFKIAFHPDDGYEPGHYSALQTFIAGMPRDT